MAQAQAVNFEQAWSRHAAAAREHCSAPGCVYTPRPLALRLAAAVLAPLPPQPAPRLLDPACGAGSLLLGALEWAAAERPQWAEAWLSGGMTGWDASAGAVEACNRVLGAGIAFQRDALADAPLPAFDVVLANPPWISLSGRQSGLLSDPARDDLCARFESLSGWPALHAAFAERCAQLTQPDGRCGLLLPLQVADLGGYQAARRAMTRNHRIESVIELGEDAFEGVTEPAGMFVLAPGRDYAEPWLATDDDLPARINGRFQPLSPGAFGDIGVHTGNAGDLLIATTPGPGAEPIRVGRDVMPYKLAMPTRWLREIDLPEGRYARIAAPERFQDAIIVLRQTASRPIAARHAPSALFRNSVLACFGAPGHDPDYLVGVFNSEIAARLHRALFRDARQRTFPQVKIGHLRKLPVPGHEIGPLYEQIANASRSAAAGTAGAAKDVDRLVSRAYGL